ncbi:hypothetical protein IWQ60_002797 [Tieghemiomyces parasiticus]|uniref:Uncharacterized protein n=1 Tax=Tieghemiomyces parasiticus TaxID=78921 RepID=A0A9W8E0N1_9FUNG|nr:hypothetical protein IWQ60_002797 [Tieghemiomyces parasiticus]
MVVRLLRFHGEWLRDDAITAERCYWIYSLLLRLDPLLDADDIYVLRALCRECAEVRRRLKPTDLSRAASVNTVITLVNRIFGQRDLL